MALQALRIPSGWFVSWNAFPDLPVSEQTIGEFSSNSLLLIHQPSINKTIEVVWLPENDINGQFHLLVLNSLEVFNPVTKNYDISADWEDIDFKFLTPDRNQLIKELEYQLRTVTPFKDPRILIKRGVVHQEAEQLRKQLKSNPPDAKIFQQVLRIAHPTLDLCLINHPDITEEMLRYFITNGQNKKIKNQAKHVLAKNQVE